jgi:hypothetical protein
LIKSLAPSREVADGWNEARSDGGYKAVVRAVLDYQISQSGRRCTRVPQTAGLMLALLGEQDRMFECLDEAIRLKTAPSFVKVWPAFEPYRSDPRFIALLRRMGLEE